MASSKVTASTLGGALLFTGVPTTELEPLAAHSRFQRFTPGDVVVRRGDPAAHFFIVDQGRLKVSTTSSDGRERVLGGLVASDHFGELALLDGRPRTCDVLAETPCRLILIDRDEFLRFIQTRPRIADRLMTILRHELGQEQEQAIRRVSFVDVSGRITWAMHQLAEEEERAQPVVEVLPVQLRSREIRWYRPRSARSWQLGSDESIHPGDLAVNKLQEARVDPIIVHSTSWRFEGDHLVLTYVAVIAEGERFPRSFVAGDVERVDLARGSATGAPEDIGVAPVVEHAMRHLSWLVLDDPVVKDRLPDPWAEILAGYEPEPFRVVVETRGHASSLSGTTA
jgi:CRP-like cAMP-binding protein